LHNLPFDVTLQDVIHERLEKGTLSSEGTESERFDTFCNPLLRVLGTSEPNLKRPAAVPEPMQAWCRNHGDALSAHGCVQIHAANALEKLLLKKPFLYPHECCIVICDSNHHGGLVNGPVPDFYRHGAQPDAYAGKKSGTGPLT